MLLYFLSYIMWFSYQSQSNGLHFEVVYAFLFVFYIKFIILSFNMDIKLTSNSRWDVKTFKNKCVVCKVDNYVKWYMKLDLMLCCVLLSSVVQWDVSARVLFLCCAYVYLYSGHVLSVARSYIPTIFYLTSLLLPLFTQ
jgi:hypothetical protein